HHVLAAEQRELRHGANLEPLRELITGTDGEGEVVVPGHAAGAEGDQVAALETEELAGAAVGRVVEPVQLDEREDLVEVFDVVINVKARIEKVGALVVGGERIARGVQEIETAPARM